MIRYRVNAALAIRAMGVAIGAVILTIEQRAGNSKSAGQMCMRVK